MAKTLEQYLREGQALQYFLEVTKREDGKAIEYKVAPYGIPATPYTGKLAVEKVEEAPAPKTSAKAAPTNTTAAKADDADAPDSGSEK